MLTGRKYRLELDFGQKLLAERIAAACRAVWNTALEQRRAYRRRGAFIGYAEQCRQLADAKKDFPWLAEAPAQALQQTLKDLDQACRRHGTWTVRWKTRTRWRPSFRFPTPKHIPVQTINRRWAQVFLPKIGWVRFRLSRPLGGTVKSATVSRDGAHWFIAFLVEDGQCTPQVHARPETAVGVDRGVITAAVTSDGEFFDRRHATATGVSCPEPPKEGKAERAAEQGYLTPGETERYLRLQRRLARATKGSGRRRRVVRALGVIMGRVRRRRADFTAQAAHRLTRDYAHVVFEDLRVRGMTASASGTAEAPGTRVAQKSGLNKAILDKGWYGLEVAVRAKARYTGSLVSTVPAAYTSQTCSVPACGWVDAKSRESQALFRCTACGQVEHADVNAAKCVKIRGQAAGPVVSGRGDCGGARVGEASSTRSTARGAPRVAA
ncbi:RNA-guided endonuclease InsQ/TnpB family protein [Planomonospora parontospora]|uniref:RNA-guided endonuclease InsQ/TnpB family protein n=1 Tax=Planomonospora parontospora TaxID=58119 RepID=UPI0016712A24|nr:RNA-guided endonuclease TnpB family protein [Planomonospora parontospora]GGL41854.1 IS element transposase [Planomonospora parontospora subsp. antibiotica]GII18296.1 IS element transposase [Planomonospora parontospora subsp. antibiotica]